MDWNRNKLILLITLMLSLAFNCLADGPLEKDQWKDLKENLEYVETPQQEQAQGSAFWAGFFATLFGSTAYLIGVILLIAILGFLIYLMVKGSQKVKIPKKEPGIQIAFEEDEIDKDLTYDQLKLSLEKAKREENYRLCIGLIYQMCIKKLSESGIVSYHPEKTNWDYVEDLNQKRSVKDFGQLTMVHEFVWYGNAPLNTPQYQSMESHFQRFLNSSLFNE